MHRAVCRPGGSEAFAHNFVSTVSFVEQVLYLYLGNAAVSGASLGVMLRMNTWRGSNNM